MLLHNDLTLNETDAALYNVADHAALRVKMVGLLHRAAAVPSEQLLGILTEYMVHEGHEGRPFSEYFQFV